MKYSVCLFYSLFSLTPWVGAQEQGKTPDPAATRELIRQWVKTERLVSEEKTTWQVEKKRMQDLLDLYQKELKLLDEEIGKAGMSTSLVDKNKEKLQTELKQYREAQQLLRETMARLLPRMKALITRLPQPLLEELVSDVDLLNTEGALEKPRDILKSMIAVLTAAGRFNRSITVAEETREITEGKKMTVQVIYLGLCRAFYTTSAGDTAGVGTPAGDGWKWEPDSQLADEIRRTIAVYQKDKQPQLIKLPVKVLGNENK